MHANPPILLLDDGPTWILDFQHRKRDHFIRHGDGHDGSFLPFNLSLPDRNDRFPGQPADPYLPPHSEASDSPIHNHGYLPHSLHPQRPQVPLFSPFLSPSLLVGVSSFGLIALVVSLLILFFYGVAAYGFKFESSFWFPQRGHVLSNLGVFINSLAFSLMCLSQVVAIPAGMHGRNT